MKEVVNNLKKLRVIKPEPDFSRRSRLLLLQEHPRPTLTTLINLREVLKFSIALSFTAALLIITLGSLTYVKKSPLPLVVAGLDISALKAEAESLNIDISLSELEYNSSSPTLPPADSQDQNNNTAYFEQTILNNETADIKLENPVNGDIDKALRAISK